MEEPVKEIHMAGPSPCPAFLNMQSLLSASESNVLQSFLSVMDYPDDTLTAKEWALLSSHSVATSSDNASFVEAATPNPGHKEALAKATKDLMSLEPEHWRAMQNTQDSVRGLQLEFHHRRQQSGLGLNTSFSFSQGKLQLDPQLAHMDGVKPSSSSPSVPHLSPSTKGDDHHHLTGPPQPSHQLTDSSSNRHLRSSARNTANASSSSSRQAIHPSSASSSSTPSSSSSQSTSKHALSSKRNRTSSSTSPSSSETPLITPTQKQPLLSPSQKKANHIQSEQKRRANIRRGYEALCETVPALREAIKQEEEEAALMAEKLNGTGRKKRKKGQGKEGGNGDKDKGDGRAGPRSENVVLTKTIEHIQDLHSDQSALLARLQHARSMLPIGHPALTPQLDPPWERMWNGGEGKVIADGEEDGASSEGDE